MYICTILHNFPSQRAAKDYNLVKAAWSPVVRSKQTGVLSHLVPVCEAKGMRHSTTPTPYLAIMHAYLISAVCSLIRWTCCMFEESLECANELGWLPPLMWRIVTPVSPPVSLPVSLPVSTPVSTPVQPVLLALVLCAPL